MHCHRVKKKKENGGTIAKDANHNCKCCTYRKTVRSKNYVSSGESCAFFVNISLLSKQKIKQFFLKIVIISKGIGYSKPHHFLSKHVLLLGIATHFEGSFKVR